MRITSSSPRVTRSLAAMLAKEFAARRPLPRHATVVALEGPLGAGKTAFAQGFARALGIKKNLPSPTFTFIRRYALRRGAYRNLFHVDAYRVRNASRQILAPLGIVEEFANPKNLFLIEWPKNIARVLPPNVVRVTFRHGREERERIIGFGK